MKNDKHKVAATIVVTILLALLLNEANSWRHFDWASFWKNARQASLVHAVVATAITYLGFVLRAMRWRVFLSPTTTVDTTQLIGPTVVGFSALALLGRPGEFIRPYMIARQTKLTFSSQIAILLFERVFDTVSAGVVITAALLLSPDLRTLPHMAQLQRAIVILTMIFMILGLCLFLLARQRGVLGHVLLRVLSRVSLQFAEKVNRRLTAFGGELDLIRGRTPLVQIIVLSILTWFLSGISYLETIHAFAGARHISVTDAMVLLGFGLVGSLIQLPGGGSQQLVIIAALINVFGLRAELAVSCSLLGWLTIFMAPVPIGLMLLRYQGLSLRGLSIQVLDKVEGVP